jgi:hypothetical protein
MFQAVLNSVLVCHHRRTTFPVTSGRTPAALRRTYIVCLDCGAELPYDWQRMRVVPSGAGGNRARLVASHRVAPATPAPPESPICAEENPHDATGGEQTCEPLLPRANLSEVRADHFARPEPRGPARHADQSCAVAGGSQYVVRAKLRMQQVQVALRVLNALMMGVLAQPDDVAKLRAWAEPGQQACSTRDLAQRIMACAVSP